jgi:hypothetical protein
MLHGVLVTQKDEGYDELVEVKTIVPGPFKDADEERLFLMHLRG